MCHLARCTKSIASSLHKNSFYATKKLIVKVQGATPSKNNEMCFCKQDVFGYTHNKMSVLRTKKRIYKKVSKISLRKEKNSHVHQIHRYTNYKKRSSFFSLSILAVIVLAITICTYMWRITSNKEALVMRDFTEAKLQEQQQEKIERITKIHSIEAGTLVQKSSSSTLATTTIRRPVAQVQVPILIYHKIRDYKEKDSKKAKIFITTPASFEEQMKYLHDHGYTVIGVDDLMKAFNGGPLPDKPVIITFDDGYNGQYTYALPILEKYHDTATFFIYTDAVSAYGDYMTWEQVHGLASKGMTIAAHTKSHAKLTKIKSRKGIEQEILGSKKVLEKELGIPIVYFAYPYGLYNTEVIDVVKESGFLAAFGITQGKIEKTSNMYFLRRNNMGSSMDTFLKAIQ